MKGGKKDDLSKMWKQSRYNPNVDRYGGDGKNKRIWLRKGMFGISDF